MEENSQGDSDGPTKQKKMKLAWSYALTAFPDKHYHGFCKATVEEGNQNKPGKETCRKKCW